MHQTHRLLWNGSVVADITGVYWHDFPWLCGQISRADMPPGLRAFLEWFSDESNACKDPDESLFPRVYYDSWQLQKPNGECKTISIPVLESETNQILWR